MHAEEVWVRRLLERIRNLFSGQPQKEEPLVKSAAKKGEGSSMCPNYYGYLTTLANDAPIPEECLTCQEILECKNIWSAESGSLEVTPPFTRAYV